MSPSMIKEGLSYCDFCKKAVPVHEEVGRITVPKEQVKEFLAYARKNLPDLLAQEELDGSLSIDICANCFMKTDLVDADPQ